MCKNFQRQTCMLKLTVASHQQPFSVLQQTLFPLKLNSRISSTGCERAARWDWSSRQIKFLFVLPSPRERTSYRQGAPCYPQGGRRMQEPVYSILGLPEICLVWFRYGAALKDGAVRVNLQRVAGSSPWVEKPARTTKFEGPSCYPKKPVRYERYLQWSLC